MLGLPAFKSKQPQTGLQQSLQDPVHQRVRVCPRLLQEFRSVVSKLLAINEWFGCECDILQRQS